MAYKYTTVARWGWVIICLCLKATAGARYQDLADAFAKGGRLIIESEEYIGNYTDFIYPDLTRI
ncbi:MAG: hypothetical protein BGO43_02080 [Gammaproteobacteria bacterium 39-13]|nr:MAG: hypothetical protein BGO43_02080 [Gammaproteobacteria bacterium 39-13]